MRSFTLLCLVLFTYLSASKGITCHTLAAERGEAPYMAFVYFPGEHVGYAAVLVQPKLLISSACCGGRTEKKHGMPTARLGALSVLPASATGQQEQERMVSDIVPIYFANKYRSRDVALLVKEPFEMTSAVGPADLATSPPLLGMACLLYQFHNVTGGESGGLVLQSRSVRAVTREECSGTDEYGTLCFRGFEAPELGDFNGVVSCDGNVTAQLGAEAAEVARRADSPRLFHDLSSWWKLANCSDVECLYRTIGTPDDILELPVAFFDKSSCPVFGPGVISAVPFFALLSENVIY